MLYIGNPKVRTFEGPNQLASVLNIAV